MSSDTILYVIRLTNIDLREYEQQIVPHTDWVAKHVETGTFLYAGPLEVRKDGGMIVARTGSREALDRILAADPFLTNGIATHEVMSFIVTRGANISQLVETRQ